MAMDFNILFTSVGRRVSLVQAFRSALDQLGLGGSLLGADMSRIAPAMHVVDKVFIAPPVLDSAYVPALLEVCRKERVRLVVPLIDPELPVLAHARESFAKLGATALVSSPEAVDISMDKRKTYKFFLGHGFDTPGVFSPDQYADPTKLRYPLVIKPALGSASIGFNKVGNPEEFAFFIKLVREPVVQEFVEGEEYTLDILMDAQGKACCIVPRKRLEVRAGEVSKGMTVHNPSIIEVGKRVAEALPGAYGPITIQGILTKDQKFWLLEINPRFGGGHPLTIKAGADFPRWVIEIIAGLPSSVGPDAWETGLVMLRYDEAVFVKEQDIL